MNTFFKFAIGSYNKPVHLIRQGLVYQELRVFNPMI